MFRTKLLLKVLTGLLILFNVNCINAQNISIPDTNFKNALLNHSPLIDNNRDGEISVGEAQAFTGTLNVSNKSISNLIGIHEFTRITALECQNNNIASLDLRGNFALTKLYCNDNILTNLDVSKNTDLIFIYCYNNKLTNLDVSANIKLTRLYCYFNQLANLDISANTKVIDLRCNDNELTSLNIANGNNSNLAGMQAYLNSNLTCIQTDANIVGTTPNGWQKDTTASYNENCGSASTCTNVVNIPDANFKNALLNHSPTIDTDGDGKICENEAETFTGALSLVGKSISNFTGIEAFKALKKLDISKNSITVLDLSNNTSLEELNATEASLTSINVTKNTNLVRLIIWGNSLSEIDLTQNIKLQTLSLTNNRFTTIDVSKNTELLAFSIGKNQLTSIDVSKNIKLTALFLYNNKLTQLDISKNTALTRLRSENNGLTSLNIANGNNTNMTLMQAQNNPSLTCIQTDANIVGTSPNNWEKDATASYSANCSSASTCTNIVNIPDANFKNALLNYSLVIDTNLDGEICQSEAEAFTGDLSLVGKSISDFTGIEAFKALKKLDVSRNTITALDLSNNTNLEELNATEASLTSINVTKNTNLVKFIIWGNSLSEIDLTQNIKLQTLSLSSNRFTTIDVSKNTELLAFSIGENQLTSIDVSKNIKLTALFLYDNKLTQLDISKNTALTRLRSENNELTSLNIANGNNTSLTELQAQNNPNLTCIQTDASIVGTSPNNWYKDTTASYNENCSNSTIAVTSITVSGSDITTNGGTSQMSVNVLPSNATDKTVTWSVDDTSIATISASGLLTAVLNGTVIVTATANDGSGVRGTKQVTVSGQGNPTTTTVVVPKGFSPNGDGQNDTWVVQNITNYPNNSVEIFNRWGKHVYKTTNYSNDWDGTSSNGSNKLPVGAYLYIINFNDGSKQPMKGWIYLNY